MIYYFGIDIPVCNKLQEEFYDLQIIWHADLEGFKLVSKLTFKKNN